MKISWGVKITVLYIGFVTMIVFMVSMAMRQNVDLVAADYYDQELKFQDRIDLINRTKNLKEQMNWEVREDSIILNFPEQFKNQLINAEVYFFRPSDAALDKKIALKAGISGVKKIPVRILKKGLYKMQINWNTAGVEYYNEGIIQIQ